MIVARLVRRAARLMLPAFVMLGLMSSSGAGAVQIGGVDPKQEPIPATGFACYQEIAGDAYAAPAFILQIQSGRSYVTPFGQGTFSIDPSETLQLTWTSGPLAGDVIPSAVSFDDWGQRLSVRTPGGEFQCYQSGARQQVALIDFGLKDPAVAIYSCAERVSGGAARPLEMLPGRTYSVGGATGSYTVNVMGDQSDDFSGLEFTSGPLTGETAFYEQNGDTGLRRLSVYTTPRLDCGSLGRPSPRPRFGAGRAPRPPAGSGGLSGLYASYQIDVAHVCGGLCWRFLFFKPDGRVYTREPETGLGDADCSRTRPNGQPLCETYKRTGSSITIGADAPKSFAKTAKGLRINGTLYRPVAPSPGQRLSGAYRSFSYTPDAAGTGGVSVERSFTFTTAGRFSRQGFAGASFFPLPGNGGGSVVTTSGNSSAGTYRAVAANSLEFRFSDGSAVRVFFFLPDGPTRGSRPKAVRIAGNDYIPK